MSSFRKERLGEAIRKVVTEKLMRGHALIPKGFVTINRVDVTPDLGAAKIFYSVFGGDVSENDAKAAMKKHLPEFRYEISQKLDLRRTPQIEFCFDKNTEYAFKINDLLKVNED